MIRRSPLPVLFLLTAFGSNLQAQQAAGNMAKDTIQIKEVVVTQQIVLSDENAVKHYQSFYSSGIDKINERLGSMSLISRGAYAKEPVLNGFSSGQINVTIGGMKMFGACTDKMDPVTSYVEPVNLKSIRINEGSTGNKNGSTIGGTFDMELQPPEKSAFTVEAGTNYETASKGKTVFFLSNFGKERWAYRISGVYKHYSPYTDGNGRKVPFTQYEKVNLLQSVLFSPAAGHDLTFDWLIDDAFAVGYPALPMDVSRAKGRIYSLKYVPEKFLRLSDFNSRVYYNTVYHLMDDSRRDSLYLVENSQTGKPDSVYMKMDMPGWSRTWGAFAEGKARWSESNLLSFKLESYRNWQKAEMTMFMNNLSNPGEPPMFAQTWPEHRRQVSGIFLRNDYVLSRKVVLAIDLRADYSASKVLSEQGKQQFSSLGYDVDKPCHAFVHSANFTMAYTPGDTWQVKAGFGRGERLPTLSEQFGFYLFNAYDGYDYIGNPEIRTEKSLNVFGKLSYTRPAFKVSADARYNHISDYILGVTVPDYEALNLYAAGTKQYENIGGARTFSTQFQLFWKLLPELEFFNVLKYNRGETNDNEPLPLMPPLKNLFSIHFEKRNYQLQIENEYSAPQNRINAGYGETKTPQFTLLHLRTGYKIRTGKSVVNLNAGVENLLDKAYSEHLDWGNYNRPGRNFYFMISWKGLH
ncbi:MAG: TonB-dependent receptor [Prolixibacteraceae bacterium]